MFDLIKVLFFAKTVLLTPTQISFDDEYVLNLKEPVTAISPTAHIKIDVTEMLSIESKDNITGNLDMLAKYFPESSVQVELISKEAGVKKVLSRVSYGVGNEYLVVFVLGNKDVPTDVAFDQVTVRTKVPLENVEIYWQNTMK
jgi:hypothetical protein